MNDSRKQWVVEKAGSFEKDFYIREDGVTDESYGSYPTKRHIIDYIRNGVVCIDKPMGPTSHEVTVWVRRILKVKKTGHTGTLDPRVTGVLPVLIEKATKLLKILQTSDKEYVTLMRLHSEIEEDKLRKTINMFIGKIYQRPPLKSAVKKIIRVREIYQIDILEIDGRDVLFRVKTEAGTYIRKLCTDIGEVLGCGAHMQELRRIGTGIFGEESCHTLHDLQDAYTFWKEEEEEKYLRQIIRPLEFSLSKIPKVIIKDSAIDAICHGADLTARGILYVEKKIKKGDDAGIFSLKNELVAVGKALVDSDEMYRMKSGVAVDTSRVIMERGTYPAMWKT
ncbi:MAG TPA: RNA-guided pseudouridylation complex pseudouridine synthase subunit Cbf5 [Archaeoglobaceae archaeon]|nr:RNA-guided pseudouridylation complex pseudouridine synthase subunit Cbf5 [Archaeoglobaceae archaeon]